MKIQKIILSFVLLFWLFNLTLAKDNEIKEPKIKEITYSSELSEKTVVNIKWEDFWKCTQLKINDKYVNFTQSWETRVNYNHREADNAYNWKLELTCEWETLIESFAFPHIEKIEFTKKWSRDIYIQWENFYPKINVTLESGKFDLKNSTLTSLFWTLPNDLNKLWLYVIADGKKSNKIEIPLDLIHIDYLKTDTNFWVGETMQICWKYFTDEDDLYINNKLFEETKELKNNCFYIKIPEIDKKEVDIYVENQYYKSNEIKFKPLWYKPEIKYIWEIVASTNSNGDEIRRLVINWEKFWTEKANVKVMVNGQTTTVYSVTDKEIVLSSYKAGREINFAQVEILWNYSDLFEFNSSDKEYNISSYVFWDVIDNKVEVTLMLSNGLPNKAKEEVKISNSKVEIDSVFNNTIRVKVPVSKLTWYLAIYRGWEQVSNTIFYDARRNNSFYVDEFVFTWDRKPNKTFYISWDKLHNADITTSNILDKEKEKYSRIKNSWTKIESILWRDYNPTANSSFTLKKNGISLSRNFKSSDIVNNKVSLPPEIYWVQTDKPGIKVWDKIRINWSGFKSDDIILFGNIKTYALKEENFDNKYIETIVPEWVKWKINLSVQRAENSQKAKNYSIIVLSDLDDRTVSVSLKNPSMTKKFKTFSLTDKIVAEYNIVNKLEDFFVDNIKFKVDNFADRNDMWSFKLDINWIKYSTNIIDPEGYLKFKNVIIPSKTSDQTMKLYKESVFTKPMNFNISLIDITAKDSDKNNVSDYIKIIDNKKSIEVIADLWDTCIDSEKDKSNCNRAILNETQEIKEDKKIQEKPINNNVDKLDTQVDKKEEVSTKQENKTQEVDSKKVEIIMDKLEQIVNSKSKWNLNIKIKIYEWLQVWLQDMYNQYKNKDIWPLIREVLNKTRVKTLLLKKSK